eukprot:169468-Chlamydomonas_euryale.AAC.2
MVIQNNEIGLLVHVSGERRSGTRDRDVGGHEGGRHPSGQVHAGFLCRGHLKRCRRLLVSVSCVSHCKLWIEVI